MAKNEWDEFPPASPVDVALHAEGVSGKVADVARSIYEQESGSGRNTKTSNAGAVGGMQVIPTTFKEVADPDWDIKDPVHNARAGVRYVKKMADRAGGDPALTAAGYYGGPGGQDKARKGVAVSDPRNPNAPTTLEYGQQVASRVAKSVPVSAAAPAAPLVKTSSEDWSQFPAATADELKAAEKAKTPAAAAPPAAAPQRSLLSELGRQLGLTARAGVNGLVALPAMASDAITGPINAGLDAAAGEGNGFRFKQAGKSVDDLMTAAGVATPENAQERVVQDIAGGMAGAGGLIRGGAALANSAVGPTTQAVGKMLAAGPKVQLAGAAAGTGAASVTRENGGGAGAQLAAGVVGSLAPTVGPAVAAATVRGAVRGGEAGRLQAAKNLRTFEDAGVSPTVGQLVGGKVQRVEALVAKVPGGAGVIARYADKQADDMATAVQRLSDELAPGASAANAGEAIQRGVQAFKGGFKSVQQKLYNNLDRHIPAATPIQVTKTQEALAALNEGVAGAPNISAFFKNAKMSAIDRALLADLDIATKAQAPVGMSSTGATRAPGGLPYQALKKLRTLVGNEIADNNLVSDVPRSKWTALYGALSEDLGVAAKKAGPEAEQAWSWANQFTRTNLERLDQLSTIVSRDSPERIFTAAISGSSEGDTIVRRVINALPKPERREVAAAVLQRMGRATPGQQNSLGDAFSSETFLSNLSKLSPSARQTIFGRTDRKGIEQQVGKFAEVAAMRREGGRIFANPSGTASTGAQLVNASAVGGGLAAAATGNLMPLAGAVSAPLVANAGARILTSPNVARKLASATELADGALPAMVGAAGRTGDAGPGVPGEFDDFPIVEGEAVIPGAGVDTPAADPSMVMPIDNEQAPGETELPPTGEDEEVMSGQTAAVGPAAGEAPAPAPEWIASGPPPGLRSDGTLRLQGNPAELRQTLIEAGIPAASLARTKDGVMVGRTQANRVQQVVAAMLGQLGVEGEQSAEIAAVSGEGAPVLPVASIDESAHAAATSPLNDLRDPTPGQIAAGNYKKGHIKVHGMDISVENPRGSVRRGTDPDGNPWESELASHYGYLRRTRGADDEQIDVFIGPNPDSRKVYVVDQLNADGSFDEHKSLIGYNSEEEAREGYLANYAQGWNGLGAITPLPLAAFKSWVASGHLKEPLGDLAEASQGANVQDQALQAGSGEAQTAAAQGQALEGPDASGATATLPGAGDPALAAAGVEPPIHPIAARIQRMVDAGDNQAADRLRSGFERDGRLEAAPTELAALRQVAPDLPHLAIPQFEAMYTQLRAGGVMPAEAAARAGIVAVVHARGADVGLSHRAISALQEKLQTLPLDEAPGFSQRFVTALIKKGAIPEFDGSAQIGDLLQKSGDTALQAMAEANYGVG